MKRYLIYRAEGGTLRPHAEIAYRALTAYATGMLIDRSNDALRQAWHEALQADWDELLLVTDELLGPLGEHHLQHMLDAMATRKVDLWSLSPLAMPGVTCPPEPSFLAVRRQALEQPSLRKRLDNGAECLTSALTAQMRQKGFVYESVLPPDAPSDFQADALLLQPYTAVMEYDCPFIDLRCFTLPHALLLRHTMGEEPGRLLRWMQDTGYDTNPLWDWLLAGPFDLNVVENLGLMACLPTFPPPDALPCPAGKCCLLMHLYFTELGEEALHYARSMPPEADVYITTPSEEKKAFFESLFASLPNHVEVRVTMNRGRDMAGLLVGLRDVTARYELCCFYHDKKSAFCTEPSVGRSFAYLISESALASPGYVQRVLSLFDENPRLGVLCAMTPHHGDYYAVNGRFWDHNLEPAHALLSRLGIALPVDENRALPAPWGNVFWFRTKALTPLLEYPWRYEDFPEEPYPVDGSVAHAMERIHCLVAQSQGYYTCLAAPEHLATLGLMNFRQYTRDYITEMDSAHLLGQHMETLQQLHKAVHRPAVRAKLRAAVALKRILGEETYLRLKERLIPSKQHSRRKSL